MKSLLLFAPLSASALLGQTGMGKIQGTVKDASAAVVPGAKVTVTHVATAREYTTSTNETGFYDFPSLQSGPYNIHISAAGMDTFKGEFLLPPGHTAVVDAALTVRA